MEKIELELDLSTEQSHSSKEHSHHVHAPSKHTHENLHETRAGRARMKKKPVSKLRFYFLNIVLAVILIIVLACLYVYFFCTYQNSVCTKTKYLTKEEIEQIYYEENEPTNTILLWGYHLFHKEKEVPFCDKIRLSVAGPHTLKFNVTEKDLYGVMPYGKNRYVYYDSQGKVCEISKRLIESVRMVEGLTVKKPTLGEDAFSNKAYFKAITNLDKFLKETDYSTDHIVFDPDKTYGFYYQDIFVDLGDTENLQEKIKRLSYILEQLDGESGTVHLSEWSQENSDIIFEKK